MTRDEAWAVVLDNEGLIIAVGQDLMKKLTGSPVMQLIGPDEVWDELKVSGYEGLLKAVETFDESKGIKLSTFAWVCIKNRMLDQLSKMMKQEAGESFVPVSLSEPETEAALDDYIHADSRLQVPDFADELVAQMDAERVTRVAGRILDDEVAEPARHRFILAAQGLTQVEIAKREGVTEGAISHSVTAVRAHLQKRLKELGYAEA